MLNADVAALRMYCKMAIDIDGLPNMQKLGRKMLNDLPPEGVCVCVCVCVCAHSHVHVCVQQLHCMYAYCMPYVLSHKVYGQCSSTT